MKENFKEKLISSWKSFLKDPILYLLMFVIIGMCYGATLFIIIAIIFGFYSDLTDDDAESYLLVWFGAIFLLVIYLWLKSLYLKWQKRHKKTTIEPTKASEEQLAQHLKKSLPRKDQDDQVMVTNDKKEKSLYQRLKEMPLSKDRVGQSIIIVRGRHVIKPKSKSSKPGENKDT